MAAFFGQQVSVPSATATKIVEAEDFDRRVLLADASAVSLRMAFTSADAPTGAFVASLSQGSANGPLEFDLPADEELWVYAASAQTPSVLVTTTAR